MAKTKLIMLIVLVCTLSACFEREEIDSKFYLETHPDVLMREMKRCDEREKMANLFSAHCRRVTQAFNEFSQLVKERQLDPLGFGERIIRLQMITKPTVKEAQDLAEMLAVVSASGPE